jgi:hypothetical protein
MRKGFRWLSRHLLCLVMLSLCAGTMLCHDVQAQDLAPSGTPAAESPANAPPPGSSDTAERRGNAPPPATPAASAGTSEGPRIYWTYKTPYEYYLAGITVALGVLMAALVCMLSFKRELNGEIIRTFLLVVIVFSALFLIVAGYSEKQTAPVFGLLGTILGYMFGRTTNVEVKEEAKAAVIVARQEDAAAKAATRRGKQG